jgi:hypothetical protein
MRNRPLAAVLLAGSLLVSACSENKVDAATAPTPTTTKSTTTTTEGPPPRSMLTGQRLDPAVLDRPVVAVKIDNVDRVSTPQSGINAADVVYEIPVEGGITRFLALFQASDAAPVGPVRSARTSEIGLLEELDRPLFTWHGANGILGPLVRQSQVVPRSFDDVPDLFYRDRSRRAPYNSYVRGTAEVRATAPDDATAPDEPLFAFAEGDEPPSPTAVPATRVTIAFPVPFGGHGIDFSVTYEWDGQKWLRSQNGRPHVDSDGVRVAADNVIVRFTNAVDSGTVDSAGSRVPTAEVVGEGDVWVLSRGTVTTGRWRKPDNASPTEYVDGEGEPIRVSRGKTWVALPYGSAGSSFG